MMRKLADLLVQHKEYLAELDSVAMGRPMYGPYGSIGDAEGARIFVNYWAVRRLWPIKASVYASGRAWARICTAKPP
jgi:hypothetical protein